MSTTSTVYIDESGDLGYGAGTQWFVLTAVIVDKDNERFIRNNIGRIRTRLNLKEIHFRKILDFYKRAYIVKELQAEPFVFSSVLIDTNKLDKSKIPSPTIAYNYACKYLLERVSWYLRDTGKTSDIVLSARGTSRDRELVDYINEKLFPYPDNRIESRYFGSVRVKQSSEWDLLQLADVCATSVFLSYEINKWGMVLPCFVKYLSDHLYRYGSQITMYGIKYFNDEMKPDIGRLITLSPCYMQKEKAPGTTTTS